MSSHPYCPTADVSLIANIYVATKYYNLLHSVIPLCRYLLLARSFCQRTAWVAFAFVIHVILLYIAKRLRISRGGGMGFCKITC
ncbi:hypothetical protein BDZ45DRAFT_36193 [Acephala macrosclerotiorum]|nr:hypothetical protein BDZ45DRAFT_36193 [Acephala macrosclerotiorum]